ncbi:hypothetical protein BASA61_001374 [Batrachochytrium salamandrivorans]|nr:hypothetical protein BASA62_007201 [Batrachochytrium salamandrivorans]KAH6602170.1 hypothetical protein BASA61_001374 [Batrachochytrium salamandrivorans]
MPEVTFEGVPYFVEGEEGGELGVVVIQEWWGVTPHIKRITGRFAKALGGLAISPDLYRGKVAAHSDEATHLMGALDWPQAVEDIRNAAKYLRSKGAKKVGVVGFCMGGALTIAAAVKVKEIDAGSCFYGIPPAAFADPKDIQCVMQYHFGEHDDAKGFSDKEAALALKANLESTNQDVSEFYIWNAGHDGLLLLPQIGILVDTHPFSVDHCILCDQQLLSTSIAHLVVECEQVTGHRIQSGLVPAIQKSRLRLLGRALDPGVENVYTWLRGGVLNGEADLDQRWLDGTVEHESIGGRGMIIGR